jgi:crotonobetainyl-CoA:carnitine CoA-transferase CaiB-like acyl-CoA transferase
MALSDSGAAASVVAGEHKSGTETMDGVLSGYRVLDFGRYIAGPYCASLLAEFGADVIRIEKRSGGEDRFQAPVTDTGEGPLFLQMNRNKRCLTLDPMKPEGQEVVRRLVTSADVVIANLPPQTLAAMKLDYGNLKAVKPDIILTHVTAYGQGGPYSDRVGFDGVAQVMSGAVYMTSEGDGETPYRAQAPWVDFGTALHCAYGTVLALMARQKTGKGQIVEGALLATALATTNASLIEQAVMNVNRTPTGNRGQTAAPVDIFKTKDGWILAQVIGQPLYERWAQLMGESMWLSDPRFKDDFSRGEHGKVVSERMSLWCAERTSKEALDTLGKAMIPAGEVLKPQETLDNPHVQAMGFFQPTEFPGMRKPAPLSRAPVKLSETPGRIVHRAPTLGEHTDEILNELGYDAVAIEALREKRIV